MSLSVMVMKKGNPSKPIYQCFDTYAIEWLQNILCEEDPNGNYWEAQFDFSDVNLEKIKKRVTKINQEATKFLEALNQIELEGRENFTYSGGTA